MLRDLRQAAETDAYEYDLCIAGAGAAGIALAMEFVGARTRVCLLESGGLDIDADTQDLYRGEVVGLPYADLDVSRLRFFGGTTNHWAGYCAPFAGYAFEPQPWIPHSGWPIRLANVTAYYQRAHDRLGMEAEAWGPNGWDMAAVQRALGLPAFPLEGFEDRAYVIKAVHMGEVFREPLESAANVDVFLNANVTEILTNEAASAVRGLRVRTLDRREFVFRARHYVVAAGGIENARLLLNSAGVQAEGLGNGTGLVGRFFSDHVAIEAGIIGVADRGANLELYERQPYGSASEVVVYKDITFAAQAREGLTSGNVRLTRMGSETAGLNSLRHLARGRSDDLARHIRNVVTDLGGVVDVIGDYLWYGRAPLDRLAVQFNLDAAPNPGSRVTLGDEVDPLGLRRVRLDWQLSEIDERTVRWMAQQLAAAVAATDFGRLKLDFDPADVGSAVNWHYHNISTTRMASDPAEGVVDADCRVHGIDNLYMGGSSVFATCGGGSPTLMIVALAIRLGDHLKLRGLA